MDPLCTEKLEMALSKNVSQLKLIPTGCRTSSRVCIFDSRRNIHIKTGTAYTIFGINEVNKPMYQMNEQTRFKRTVRRLVGVTVPGHVKPGDSFKVRYKTQLFLLTCPVGVSPGSMLRFALPSTSKTTKKK